MNIRDELNRSPSSAEIQIDRYCFGALALEMTAIFLSN
jgi:hypothetical protein